MDVIGCFEMSVWLFIAVLTALGIAYDMGRLRVSCVRFTRWGWIPICLGLGPFAVVLYLVRRRATRQALIDGVWQVVGDETFPASVRCQRLLRLQHYGLIGKPIFMACRNALDKQWSEQIAGVTKQ